VVEGLRKSISTTRRSRIIQGIRVRGNERSTYLLFFDEVLLFTNGFALEGRMF